MEDLLRYSQQKYIVYDFETCGLSLSSLDNKPWQLGLLVCENNQIIERHNFYIKWDNLNISKEAAIVTKFNKEDYLRKAQDSKYCLDILEKYLYNKDYLCLFHNGLQFDVYIHNIYRKLLGLKTDYSYINRCIDTNALAKGIKLGIKYDKYQDNDLLAYQYRMLSIRQKGLKTNLTQLGQENNIEFQYDRLHDGVKDCELLWLIWTKVIRWQIDI